MHQGPDRVKIVWTLEAEPLAQDVTRFATETRAAGTDAGARAKFRRYWRLVGLGVVLIRRLHLPLRRRPSAGGAAGDCRGPPFDSFASFGRDAPRARVST